ncbi:hypothetical protein ACG04R_16525 [Roseateles sp. BYS78W]|uniref:DUF5666 domain-containing protein n=1 Tax=Pelomonas candidula TaxID=3299025 RepID=A0ABW7HEG3_9BURK
MSKTLKTIIAATLTAAAGIASAEPAMTEAQFDAYAHRDGGPTLVLTPGKVTAVIKDGEHTLVRTDAAKAAASFDGDKATYFHVGDKVGVALVNVTNGVRLYVEKAHQ